jgi:hypothetical protein
LATLKKQIENTGSLILALLYCMVIFYGKSYTVHFNDFSNGKNATGSSYASFDSNGALCHTAETETWSIPGCKSQVCTNNKISNPFLFPGSISDRGLESIFTLFILRAKPALFQPSKTALIFPFHYFW